VVQPPSRLGTTAQGFARVIACVTALAGSPGCEQVRFTAEADDGDDDAWTPPDMPPSWGDSSDPSTSAGDGDGDGDADPKLDLPPGSETVPCSVVDLLFVIDNSNSMIAEQGNLIASFDGFIAGIQTYLDEANDYHIGLVTTDAYALNADGCRELGALVTDSAAGNCGPWTNGRFITLADDLAGAFTCAANVGGDGNGDEHQVEAALRAISPELAEPGACNEGFLRDDALLVLVIITDEDDGAVFGQGSPGNPNDWAAQLVARKGVESNVVILALAGVPSPNACNLDIPFEGAQLATRLRMFVQSFTYGRMGDVCADDYAPFFADSLEVIHDACINFTPEG
jgi:hypothetical protein